MLIEVYDPAFQLEMPEMDETHREFLGLLNLLAEAKGHDFEKLFNSLYEHTEQHFTREKELMQDSDFPAVTEHLDEHKRILGELKQYRRKVSKGATGFARAYVTDRLPEWFRLHLSTMDSALAAHLKQFEVA
jgi:hemerythrin-like metal-binding protein